VQRAACSASPSRRATVRRHFVLLTLVGLAAACERGPDTGPGISWALAQHRAATLADVRYEIELTIPDDRETPVEGRVVAGFTRRDRSEPVVFDFRAPVEHLREVRVDGAPARHEVRNGHIVIPADAFAQPEQSVEITFIAGNAALNRNDEFLYTLFVPDRASTALPLFDQPNLKARFRLTLHLPVDWEAVANGPPVAVDTVGAIKTVRFASTRPLPTYLFAFAAGRFEVIAVERDGRTLQLYHRETDRERLERNVDTIFDLHAAALSWLERYTGIPYPFEKFAFVGIPSFQYGGMEHPGAVLYRASSLLLDETPTQTERLGRASLIAHETAHMWFGDLVTMPWFDDVWMKEVFANFMAAKIVHPSFPDINHDLRFFLAHHPAAYAVDRTAGTHPIRQQLNNLDEAGSLYGAIIYQKAPIAMRHLEALLGEEAMREGLREYLASARYGNASWPDLIAILDDRTPEDLRAWSRVWVEQSGRPTVTVRAAGTGSTLEHLAVTQSDPHGRGRRWTQEMEVVLGYADSLRAVPLTLADAEHVLPQAADLRVPDFVLPGGDGLSYGRFTLEGASLRGLTQRLSAIDDPVVRAVGWTTLFEEMLDGTYRPRALLELVLRSLPHEADELILQQMLGVLRTAYWRFLAPEERRTLSARVERALWRELERRATAGAKAACFEAYVSVALTDDAVGRLRRLWAGEVTIPDLPLSERRLTSLAEALAVRAVPGWASILTRQLERIDNPDRRDRFRFVMPALSADRAVRDSVFLSLADAANREHEPWVLSAVRYLHHPLRSDEALAYVMPSLELLQEIQSTGDIFFPLRWLDATLGGHQQPAVADSVTMFLARRPDYPPRLAGKLLQAADGLFRAADIVHGWQGRAAAERLGREIATSGR
jgi:aminopeptidase N